MLAVLLHRLVAFPIGPRIEWIGGVNPAVRPNPKIVRAIEQFPVEIFHQHGDFLVECDGPKLVLLVGAGDEVAVLVKVSAVGPAARFHPVADSAVGRAPFHDAVVGLIGEEDVAVLVGGGAFGEFKTASEFFQSGARRYDFGIRGAQETGGEEQDNSGDQRSGGASQWRRAGSWSR